MENKSFISKIASLVIDSYNLKDEELTIVFPNKRAAYYLRSELIKNVKQTIWLPQILSIQEAFSAWSGTNLIDNTDMLFELIDIDTEMKHHVNSDIAVFGGLASQMAKDFDEIDQYKINAQSLFNYIVEEKKIGLWNPEQKETEKEKAYIKFFESLLSYYTALRKKLSDDNRGYYGMITRSLSDMSDEELVEKTKNRKILFAGFNALTPTEEEIIDKLVKAGNAKVIWDYDSYYIENHRCEAGLFARQYIKSHPKWKPEQLENELSEGEKNIYSIGVNGNSIQAKALQCNLEHSNDKNVAIILADEGLLIPVLNAIPDNEKYKRLEVSMGYPMQMTPLSQFLFQLFKLQAGKGISNSKGWYIWSFLHIFDMELVKIIFKSKEIKEFNDWKNAALKSSSYFIKNEDFKKSIKNESIKKFLDLCLNRFSEPRCFLNNLCLLLSFIVSKIQDKETENQVFLLNQVSEMGKVANRLLGVFEKYSNYIPDLNSLEILYRLIVNEMRIKLNGTSTDGLQIMGLLETRNLDFETVHIISVNEGVLPTKKSQNSMIPYNIRSEYKLPNYWEKQAVFAYHFYRLLQNSKNIYLYYNTLCNNSQGEPSRYILQIEHELLKNNPKIKFHSSNFTNTTQNQGHNNAIRVDKTEEVMNALKKKIAPEKQNEKGLAPTSLSSYINCPLQFYLRYIEKIDDNTVDEEMQKNVIGSIVHETLENLYKDYCRQIITESLFETVISKSINQKLESVIKKKFEQGLPTIGYNYLDQKVIDNLLDNYIRYESYNLKKKELIIIGLEQELSHVLPVRGQHCRLSGFADRIDKFDGLTRIIDYKTGRVFSKNLCVKDNVEKAEDIEEKALQLMIYKYLYLKKHPEIPENEVTAGIIGLRYVSNFFFGLTIKQQDLIDHFVETTETYIISILDEILNSEIPFTQTKNEDHCTFCAYQNICKRDNKIK
jgi:Inactivated superfamily I helicase